MADLIDRQAALDALTSVKGAKILNNSTIKCLQLIDLLEALPAVDAVEVVRCKDCKHREKCNLMTDDDFCSDGERREENG